MDSNIFMWKHFGLAAKTAARVGAKLALGDTELGVYTKTMEDERCKNLDSRGLCIGIWEVGVWRTGRRILREEGATYSGAILRLGHNTLSLLR